MPADPTLTQRLANAGPVYPIPPSFIEGEVLSTLNVKRYLTYLQEQGAKTVMTTAGTSRFAHLHPGEIASLGKALSSFDGTRIVGVPPLPTNRAVTWMNDLAMDYPVDAFLVLYPDRYYTPSLVVDYFTTLANSVEAPVLIHAAPLRHARGGQWDYDPPTLAMLRRHPNIIGMKEECSTLAKAYEVTRLGQVKGLPDDFVVISAGGSVRRFSLTWMAGAHTYLAGVGSFWPHSEYAAWLDILEGRTAEVRAWLESWENVLFDCFMRLGWHRCLAYGLHYLELLCNDEPREPWPHLRDEELEEVEFVLNKLKGHTVR